MSDLISNKTKADIIRLVRDLIKLGYLNEEDQHYFAENVANVALTSDDTQLNIGAIIYLDQYFLHRSQDLQLQTNLVQAVLHYFNVWNQKGITDLKLIKAISKMFSDIVLNWNQICISTQKISCFEDDPKFNYELA